MKRIPWYLWCTTAAVTSADIGVQWDIAWHRSIGRDGFWSPPHVAIYLCGVLAGLAAAVLILSTTFGKASRESTIRIWGFHGPLGAFIASWGGVAMLASAPFDDWWHGAYGLDVKILSPPHVILALGIVAIQLGSLILILGHMNRAAAAVRAPFVRLFLYVGGMLLVTLFTLTMESNQRISLHLAAFYIGAALVYPPILIGIARASQVPWAATKAAAIYSATLLGLLWVLPLVPAIPKLGPVLYPVTHLVPAGFPLLLLAPAIAIDLVLRRALNDWLAAAVAGAAFVCALLAAQWPFADFLMSPAAHNAVFGSGYLDYRSGPQSYFARNLFREAGPHDLARGLPIALAVAFISSRGGLAWGAWMRKIKR